MNFAPYHQFRQCDHLEGAVQTLREAGNVVANTCTQYDLYHYSLIHKLRSARYHVDTLGNYLDTQATATHQATPQEVVYRVNFHFDGFAYCVGSAMDIFAREVLSYFGVLLPARMYFSAVETELRASRAGDPILPLLQEPAWRQEFGEYRNTATHENVVGNHFQMVVTLEGAAERKRLVFPLPDDPRAAAKTYRHNPDIVEYCATTLRRTLSVINQVYGHLLPRIVANNHLPL